MYSANNLYAWNKEDCTGFVGKHLFQGISLRYPCSVGGGRLWGEMLLNKRRMLVIDEKNLGAVLTRSVKLKETFEFDEERNLEFVAQT
jgi:hypothetical protein